MLSVVPGNKIDPARVQESSRPTLPQELSRATISFIASRCPSGKRSRYRPVPAGPEPLNGLLGYFCASTAILLRSVEVLNPKP